LERRRRRAVELMDQGESAAVLARVLGVARGSLYRWRALARSEGLAAKPTAGPRPRLTADQLGRLEDFLHQGARAHGWPDDRWTAGRVAALIQRHFGVSYHPEHVRKLMKRHWPLSYARRARRAPKPNSRPRGGAEPQDPAAAWHRLLAEALPPPAETAQQVLAL
jgi:transposase